MKVCISIDIEDWFQLIFYKQNCPIETWTGKQLTIEEPLFFLFEALKKNRIRATFFVLGWFGENRPDLIRMIQDQGHEIASHGMSHVLNSDLGQFALDYEISYSKEILENVTGEKVLGYRAPSFSISPNVASKIIASGYKYDSSFFPFKLNSRYGYLEKEEMENIAALGLKEIPVTVGSVGGFHIPFAGGRYFRLLPTWLIEKMVMKNTNDPLVFYFHPWEFTQDTNYLINLPLKQRFQAKVGLRNIGIKNNRKKFLDLINYLKRTDFEFAAMRNII